MFNVKYKHVGYSALTFDFKMEIRKAKPTDSIRISELLLQLEYPVYDEFIEERVAELSQHQNEELIIAEKEGKIIAVLSIHFIPQLAVQGSFARISYFCVDEHARSKGIGRELEKYFEQVARDRGCDRIEVHCHSRRIRAHEFYERQGYIESPNYFIKKLN